MPTHPRRALRVVAALVVLFTAGCASLSPTAPATDTFGETGTFTGNIHGGQQPVAFATVQLYAAGTTGYGSVGTLYATTTTLDDGNGSFSFTKAANTDTAYPSTGSTWACPVTGNPFMYLVARGGNTQGTHSTSTVNTAAAAFFGVGLCSGISPAGVANMNEVTTVGSLAALQQYFNPTTESVGAPSTTQAVTGLTNAFSVIPLLIDGVHGTAQGSYTASYSITSVAETAKIDTIADVIAACLNQPSLPAANCTTLFTNAMPPAPAVTSQPSATFNTATDILQAAYYMLTNPSNGSATRLAALYGLTSSSTPFVPYLSNAPSDWTVGITFYTTSSGSGSCDPYNFIHSPTTLAIDASGELVISTVGGYAGYIRITPNGQFIYSVNYCSSADLSQQATIDPSGNLFYSVAGSTSRINEITPNYKQITYLTPAPPYAIVADGLGNIYYSSQSTNSIYQIPAATIASATTGSFFQSSSSVVIQTGFTGTPNAIAIDLSEDVWAAYGSGGLAEFTITSPTVYSYQRLTTSTVNSLAINSSSVVLYPYLASSTPAVGQFNALAVPHSTAGSALTGVANQTAIAIDGASNIWGTTSTTATINSVLSGLVSVTDKSGNPLTVGGIVKPAASSLTSSTLVQNTTILGPSSSIAIDPSGNVWVDDDSSNLFTATGGQQYCITEIVGAAVPVVTPISVGIANKTLATKP
jgi:hypothetical protein